MGRHRAPFFTVLEGENKILLPSIVRETRRDNMVTYLRLLKSTFKDTSQTFSTFL